MPDFGAPARRSQLPALCLMLVALAGSLVPDARAQCIDYRAYLHRVDALAMQAPLDGVASGGYLYLGGGGTFQVVDVSSPDSIRLVGTVAAYATGVALSGGIACLAAGGLLTTVDVSDPAVPIVRDEMQTDTGPGGSAVAVAGDLAFVVGGSYAGGAIQAINIAHPDSLHSAGLLGLPGPAAGIALAGPHAFVVYGAWNFPAGLAVVDISQAGQMEIVGDIALSPSPADVAISGDHAFVAGLGGLQVINIADPLHPYVVATLPIDGTATRLALSGHYAFVAAGALYAVDITEPWSPRLAGTVWMPGAAVSVTVSGSRAMVGYSATPEPNGLAVVDIANPEAPPVTGDLAFSSGMPYDIAIVGTLAYVADHSGGGGLRVCDLADPAVPALLGAAPVVGLAAALAMAGDYACVTGHGYGLNVLSVASPSAPQLVGQVPTPSFAANDVAVSGPWAYVADGESGLVIVSILDPSSPALTASADTPGHALGVAVSNNHAFVADWPVGLQVIDISQPWDPLAVAALPILSGPLSVATSGSIACVGVSTGVDLVDISDPVNPFLTGHVSLPMDGAAVNITIAGEFAYVADDLAGFHVLDITDRHAPRIIGEGGVAGRVQAVAVQGDLLAFGHWGSIDGASGLVVAPAQCGGTAAIDSHSSGLAAGLSVEVFPNPAADMTRLRLSSPGAGRVEVDVFDRGGRLVRRVYRGNASSSGLLLTWDGLDDRGERVPPGVYFVRSGAGGAVRTAKAILVR